MVLSIIAKHLHFGLISLKDINLKVCSDANPSCATMFLLDRRGFHLESLPNKLYFFSLFLIVRFKLCCLKVFQIISYEHMSNMIVGVSTETSRAKSEILF